MIRKISRTLFLALFVASTAHADELEQQIDPFFTQYNGTVPGAAVGIIYRGELRFAKGYGLPHLSSEDSVHSRTNFRLASLSKAFTATAVMVLVERGDLDLDQSLTDLVPEFPDYGRQIKLRHMLNHTSGLRDYESLIPSNQQTQLSDEDVLAILARQRSTYFEPGSRYRYSNSAYAILACIVARKSSVPYQEFVRNEVFTPLGMSGSVVFLEGSNQVENRAYGHTWQGRRFVQTDQSLTSAVLGDGSVYSSVDDLFLWDQMWYGDSPVLSNETINLMQAHTFTTSGRRVDYGYGWVVKNDRGRKQISHTGSTIGQRHSIIRYPAEELTVIVLVNRANAEPWATAQRIADMALNGTLDL